MLVSFFTFINILIYNFLGGIVMNFIKTFTQVLILFILILIGYFIRYRNLIDKSFTSKLSNLVLSIFLPALIINSMQINFEPSIINKIIRLC